MRNVCIAVVLLSGPPSFADHQQAVDRVFAEIRQGKLENTAMLVRLGETAVPDIARYASDPEIPVRAETISLLQQIGGDAACRAIEPLLNDSAGEIREKAIAAFFQRCDHTQVPCEQLLASLAKAQPSALAIVAAGYCGEDAKPLLTRMLKGNVQVKVEPGMPLVSRSLVASVALMNAGQEAHEVRVRTALLSKTSVVEPEFLLRVLLDLPMAVVKEAVVLLDDERPMTGNNRRRIQDAAVDAFVARFHLKVAFERTKQPRRYTAEEIASVRAAVAQVFTSGN